MSYTHEPEEREFAPLPAFCRKNKKRPVVLALGTTEKTVSIEEFLRRR